MPEERRRSCSGWGAQLFPRCAVEVQVFAAFVGHSEEADADTAIAEMPEQCRAGLDGAVPGAGLLFAAIDYEHEAMLCAIPARSRRSR